MGINGMAMMLGDDVYPSSEKYVDHIEYVSDLVGHEHVALGLDLVYFPEVLELFFQKAGHTTYPKNYVGSMNSLQPEKIQEIVEVMIKRNFTDQQIIDVLGGNFIRVAKRVWK
jgi:membrane dipeptidase